MWIVSVKEIGGFQNSVWGESRWFAVEKFHWHHKDEIDETVYYYSFVVWVQYFEEKFDKEIGGNQSADDEIDCGDMVVPEPSWRNFSRTKLIAVTNNFSFNNIFYFVSFSVFIILVLQYSVFNGSRERSSWAPLFLIEH